MATLGAKWPSGLLFLRDPYGIVTQVWTRAKKRSRKARKCLLCGLARAVWVPFRRRYIHVYERESLVCFVGFDLLTFLHDQLNLFTNWSLGDGKLKDFMIELELIAHRKMLQNLKRTAVSVIQFKFPAWMIWNCCTSTPSVTWETFTGRRKSRGICLRLCSTWLTKENK